MPEIYRLAVHNLGDPPITRHPGISAWQDDLPRRRMVRQLKETLVKSTILVGKVKRCQSHLCDELTRRCVGVGHCIEASFALGEALAEGDQDDICVRHSFDTDGLSKVRGTTGLDRVYEHNLPPIIDKMRQFGLSDIEWLSYNVTYGSLLEPVRPDNPAAALDFAETELVVLTCLMARHAHRYAVLSRSDRDCVTTDGSCKERCFGICVDVCEQE